MKNIDPTNQFSNVFQVLFLVTFRDITAFKQPIVDDEKEVGGIGGF